MSPSVSIRLLATQSDARLLELARHGHERAFEALVQRHRRALLAYCRRALLPDARAEDALQQALLHAWLALQNGVEVRDARAWLYRIVHNTALNVRRGSGYDHAELSEALTGAGAPHEDLDRRIAVREALAGLAALPEQQREALLRTAVEGQSHEQVALEMGVSEGALRGLVYRARCTLRTAVTAITPAPLVSWAVGLGSHGVTAGELAAGGSAGVAGLLLKGGAVAVTAGALATGAGTLEHRSHETHHRSAPLARAAAAGGGTTAGAPVELAAAIVQPASSAAPSGGTPAADHRRWHRRRSDGDAAEQRSQPPAAPSNPMPVESRDDDGFRHDVGGHRGWAGQPGEDRRHGNDDHHGGEEGDGRHRHSENHGRSGGSGGHDGHGEGGERHGHGWSGGDVRSPERGGHGSAGDGEEDRGRRSGSSGPGPEESDSGSGGAQRDGSGGDGDHGDDRGGPSGGVPGDDAHD